MTTPEEAATRLRSRGWRMRHSLWVLGTLPIGVLTWVSFLYVGIRARRVHWIAAAAGYLAVLIASMSLLSGGPTKSGEYTTLQDAGGFALLAMWLGGIVHAFVANRTWLRIRASHSGEPWYARELARQQSPGQPSDRPPGRPPGRGDGNGTPPQSPAGTTLPITPGMREAGYIPHDGYAGEPQREVVDINTASEQEIASLPGVGPILAMRVLSERERRGGYRDVDELAGDLHLPPHVRFEIRERLVFS